MYIENPKTKDSGILCCIPQVGECPIRCGDCFFQQGRSYLEPLDKNLPNMPDYAFVNENNLIVRVNDGNDSNNWRELVLEETKLYNNRFYNTSINKDLEGFKDPVVLTLNPGNLTDKKWHKVDPIPRNLMFVRFRVNMWNLNLLDEVINYYTPNEVPVVLTFMAYYEMEIPEQHKNDYIFKKRTLNDYWVVNNEAWERVMAKYKDNKFIYSCGKGGDKGYYECKRCGTCLREFYNTKIRIMKDK